MPRSGNIRALTTRSRSSADTSATTGGVFSKQTLPTGIATRPSPLKQQCGESVTRTDSRGLRGPTLQPSLPDTSQFRILVTIGLASVDVQIVCRPLFAVRHPSGRMDRVGHDGLDRRFRCDILRERPGSRPSRYNHQSDGNRSKHVSSSCLMFRSRGPRVRDLCSFAGEVILRCFRTDPNSRLRSWPPRPRLPSSLGAS